MMIPVVPVTFFMMIFAIAVGTPIARAYGRRMERSATLPPGIADIPSRLDRMEQTIEAIATEVERISEGQRFTTKLLSAVAETPNRLGKGSASPRGDDTYSADSPTG